jgi:hypothetical protein
MTDTRLMGVVKRKNNKLRKKYPLLYGTEGFDPITPTQQLELRRKAERIMAEPPKPAPGIDCTQYHPMYERCPENAWEPGVCPMCGERVIETDHINLVKFCYRHPIATENGVAMGPCVAEFYQQERVSKHQVLVALAKHLLNNTAWHLFLRDIGCSSIREFCTQEEIKLAIDAANGGQLAMFY